MMYLKDHWTLQWKGLNLYSRGRVLKIASFEGSGYLGYIQHIHVDYKYLYIDMSCLYVGFYMFCQ